LGGDGGEADEGGGEGESDGEKDISGVCGGA